MSRGINLLKYDDKTIHYGFFIGLNLSRFEVQHSKHFVNQLNDSSVANPIMAINSSGIPGFTTGFILNFRLNDYLDFRFLPTVGFYQRYVDFTFKNPDPNILTRHLNQSTFSFVELPLLIKYKSIRRNNMRMYMLGGIKPSYEVGAKRDELSDKVLRANRFDFCLDYGFGLDMYYPLFKFSPELRFSTGFSQMRYQEDNPDNLYARNIGKMTTNTVTLLLNFE